MPGYTIEERLERASTLEAVVYTDPRVLADEERHVFGKTWQLVGRVEQVKERGQFFTARVGGEDVLVVRGADGTLRALSNVCRHRAGPVAPCPGEGTVNAFRCGYHGWSWSLEGRLLGTPEFDGVEDFDRASVRLPEYRVETWLGLVFVNLDAGAGTLTDALDDLPARLAKRDFSAMRLSFRRDWTVDCNWKVYVDNYLEGYHIPIVHPGLMKELDYPRYRTETRRTTSIQHSPIKDVPGQRLRKEGDLEAEYYWVFPNLMLNVYPDNFSTNLIVPVGPDKTLTVFEWFFRDPESEDTRKKIAETVDFSDEVQREDIGICQAVQRGLRSRTYERGRFSVKRENGVHHFHRLWAAAMNGAGDTG